MASCPHCGRGFKGSAGYARHVRSCAKRPEREELAALVAEGVSVRSMAAQFDVSEHLVRTWLQDEGIERRGSSLAVVREWAPLFGARRTCHKCASLDGCVLRTWVGLWMACEAPEPEEVELDWWKVLVWFGWTLLRLGRFFDIIWYLVL